MKNQEEYKLLDELFDELFPIMRSITGPGIEKSMEIFQRYIPLKIIKVPTGTIVFDWIIPQEWHFERAYILDPDGKIICDTNNSTLHVVNYSEPVDIELSLEELQKHLHSIPDLPDAIPYVTSYYSRKWGFCISHNERKKLKPGKYRAVIKSEFKDGGVPYAQYKLQGESNKEILLTSYLCHPSLANNELSGPLVLLGLYNRIKKWKRRRFSYRFLLNPETIGSLCFLHNHYQEMKENLVAGMILTTVGGPDKSLHYKSSRNENSLLNKFMNYPHKKLPMPIEVLPFSPINGSDERQYCAPGFNLPVGQISRTTYGKYPGYHNSLDTKEFMTIDSLIETIDTIEEVLKYLEVVGKPINTSPFGEPQLGRRNLYPNMNSPTTRKHSSDSIIDGRTKLNRILWILNLADGNNDLMDIADKTNLTIDDLIPIILELEEKGLIKYNIKPPRL